MADKLKIGVLTSGGDAPGTNAAIRAVVRTSLTNNMEVIGIQNGYEGFINGEFRDMNERSVGGILQRGKTHAIIINAEGSGIRTTDLTEKIDNMDVGFTTRVTILGHIQRGGSLTAYDRLCWRHAWA